MRVLISGHRLHKLQGYNINWIKSAIEESLDYWGTRGLAFGLSGMASGVDLWFCDICRAMEIPYIACPPFEEQYETMDAESAKHREICLANAIEIKKIRNSSMINLSDGGIIVWDGNKGGTHNVLQQMVEKQKSFTWINPVSEKVWNCF